MGASLCTLTAFRQALEGAGPGSKATTAWYEVTDGCWHFFLNDPTFAAVFFLFLTRIQILDVWAVKVKFWSIKLQLQSVVDSERFGILVSCFYQNPNWTNLFGEKTRLFSENDLFVEFLFSGDLMLWIMERIRSSPNLTKIMIVV